jgi:hypothetical protein
MEAALLTTLANMAIANASNTIMTTSACAKGFDKVLGGLGCAIAVILKSMNRGKREVVFFMKRREII